MKKKTNDKQSGQINRSVTLPAWLDRPILNNPLIIPGILFVVTLIVRIVAIYQFRQAPNFYLPFGDAETYHLNALHILETGKWLPDAVPFQTPFFPMFVALMYAILPADLLSIRIVLSFIGAANIVLVYLISRRMLNNEWMALVSALLGSFYNMMLLFDIDILPTNLTLFSLLASIWLLLLYKDKGSLWMVIASGLMMGSAVLCRANLLLVTVAVAWFLLNEFRLRWHPVAIKPAALFLLMVAVLIAPFTINNLIKSNDLVLLASNAGINLYIGNHRGATGKMRLPEDEGLAIRGLDVFQEEVANRLTGKKLKPSQVSGYWTKRALSYWLHYPQEAVKLYLFKLQLLINEHEIPNHWSAEYLKKKFIPAMHITFMQWGWLFPVAMMGLYFVITGRKRRDAEMQMLILLLLSYTVSILPFFIVDRYRMPLVPVMLILAGFGIVELFKIVFKEDWKKTGIALSVMLCFVFLSKLESHHYSYSFSRMLMADKYLTRGEMADPPVKEDIDRAILEYKQAIEGAPGYVDPLFRLAYLYERIGYYTGAIRLFEEGLTITGHEPDIEKTLEIAKSKFKKYGNRVAESFLPRTAFEKAVQAEAEDKPEEAMNLFRTVIEQDKYNAYSYIHLAMLLKKENRWKESIAILELGVKENPDVVVLEDRLLDLYYESGLNKKAEAFKRKHHIK